MALNLNNKYPGRANPPSIDYPEGSIKNQTAPGAKDGTPLDADWANDKEGFFQSILKKAGVVANGIVDRVGASQYFDALISGFRASQSDTDSGIEDDKFITPKKLRNGFAASFNESGYLFFPSWLGGLGIQWLKVGSAPPGGAVTTPWATQFPVTCFAATCNPIGAGANTYSIGLGVAVSKAGCTVYNWGNAISMVSGFVIAVGK